MLLEDCAAVRKQAAELDLVLQGWSHMVRDLIFYALLYGRKSMWESRLSHILRGTVGEIDGVQDVEIHELRLPSASDFAPQLALAKYAGPELSEWNLKWEPPSAQVSGSIVLRGRKFGVSFSVNVAVSALRLHGELVLRWSPEDASVDIPQLFVGFKRPPTMGLDVSIQGSKALSLGSDTLRAVLIRNIDRAIANHCVLPRTVCVGMPFLRGEGFVPPNSAPNSAPPPTADGCIIPPSDGSSEASPQRHPQRHPQHEQQQQSDGSHGSGAGVGGSETGGWSEAVNEDATLRQLLALRTDSFVGPTWLLNDALASLLGAPLYELVSRKPPSDPPPQLAGQGDVHLTPEEWHARQRAEMDEWGTALVIATLQLKYHDRASLWSALIETRSLSRVHMRAAMELVCELVARSSSAT